MAELLYGSGLRLMECLRLRIKDIDFGYNRITVRDTKGLRDRVALLPQRLQQPLRGQIAHVKELHRQYLARGGGKVYLPFALERKYPNAARDLMWQYLFPAAKPSLDPSFRRTAAASRLGKEPSKRRQTGHPSGRNPKTCKLPYLQTQLRHAFARKRVRHP